MKNFVKKNLTKKSNAFLVSGLNDLMLGILAGVFVIAAGLAMFYFTRSSGNVLQFQSEIIQLSSRVSSLYTGSAGYGDLTNEIAIKGGAVPKTLIKGSNLVNAWGGTVTLSSSDDESSFFIEITNIPDEECGKLAGNQVNNWISLSINSSVLSDDSSTSDVINLCNAGKNTLKYEAR